MAGMKYIWLMMTAALTVVACGHKVNHGGQTPLVEVAGHFLYAEDLRRALPADLSKDDSLLFAEHYIRGWIEDALLMDNAERNVQQDEGIRRLVENYRRALILHDYQQRLMEQRMDTELGESETDSFYRANTAQFLLERPMAKGLYIKVPLNAKGINNVRQWYRKNDPETVERLEKYSLQHAADYLYFRDRWMPLDEMAARMPGKATATLESIRQKGCVEVRDTAFCHFLHTDTLLEAGQPAPLDHARAEIREILMNMKRVEFMKQVRTALYEEALEKKQIIYHY